MTPPLEEKTKYVALLALLAPIYAFSEGWLLS